LIDDKLAKRLVYSRFGMLILSVDGATKETFEEIRRGANFDEVINNIRRINYYKRLFKIDRPLLRFNFTAMRSNIEELSMLLDLAAELGVREITVCYLNAHFRELWEESLYFYKELSDRIMMETQERGRKMGISVTLPPLFKDGRVKAPGKERCASPWNYTYIQLDGGVKPCCYYYEPLGNLFDDDFPTIWNSEGFQELRKRLTSGDLPPCCKKCHLPANMDPNDIKVHISNISQEEVRELEEKLDKTDT
jgi:radical SAM protein with 4Fe4S-binding SPASM domain